MLCEGGPCPEANVVWEALTCNARGYNRLSELLNHRTRTRPPESADSFHAQCLSAESFLLHEAENRSDIPPKIASDGRRGIIVRHRKLQTLGNYRWKRPAGPNWRGETLKRLHQLLLRGPRWAPCEQSASGEKKKMGHYGKAPYRRSGSEPPECLGRSNEPRLQPPETIATTVFCFLLFFSSGRPRLLSAHLARLFPSRILLFKSFGTVSFLHRTPS